MSGKVSVANIFHNSSFYPITLLRFHYFFNLYIIFGIIISLFLLSLDASIYPFYH